MGRRRSRCRTGLDADCLDLSFSAPISEKKPLFPSIRMPLAIASLLRIVAREASLDSCKIGLLRRPHGFGAGIVVRNQGGCPPSKDVGRPLPSNTHGPHHYEKITFFRCLGFGRFGICDGAVVRRLLLRSVLSQRLLRLRCEILRAPVQRLQPRVLRNRVLRWLLPIWFRLWRSRLRRRLRAVRRRHVPWSHELLRRYGMRAGRMRRWRLLGIVASQRTGSQRSQSGCPTLAVAVRADFASCRQ